MNARVLGALLRRDLRCALHTPSVVAFFALGIVIEAFLLSQVGWVGPDLWEGTFGTWVFAYAFSTAPVFSSCIPSIDAPPVERARGEYATLLRADVAPGAIAASKLASGLVIALTATAAYLPAFGLPLPRVAALLGVQAAGALPMLLLSVAMGLTGRDVRENTPGTAFVSLATAFAPVAVIGLEPLATACSLLPNSGAVLAGVAVATGAAPGRGWLLTGLAYAAWLAVSALLFLLACRRFGRDVRRDALPGEGAPRA